MQYLNQHAGAMYAQASNLSGSGVFLSTLNQGAQTQTNNPAPASSFYTNPLPHSSYAMASAPYANALAFGHHKKI